MKTQISGSTNNAVKCNQLIFQQFQSNRETAETGKKLTASHADVFRGAWEARNRLNRLRILIPHQIGVRNVRFVRLFEAKVKQGKMAIVFFTQRLNLN